MVGVACYNTLVHVHVHMYIKLLVHVHVYMFANHFQLREISMAPDMDPQKKNLIIYDMNSGTKFILTATKTSVREQWLIRTQKLIQVPHTAPYLVEFGWFSAINIC